jgi:pyruvate dehydrogenase complex dehydrogenase (E1) component
VPKILFIIAHNPRRIDGTVDARADLLQEIEQVIELENQRTVLPMARRAV